MPLGRIDADEAQRPFENQLDDFLRLAHDIRVTLAPEQEIEGLAAKPCTPEIVEGEAVRRHKRTTSPGFQSGLRSQYS